jgi:hypothetical protein
MNIVIPTYYNHFQYNVNFLHSFDNFCLDKNDVKINFIVNSNEYDIFINLKEDFKQLNINIVKMSDLMFNVDNKHYNDDTNNFPSKYPLQSIKKLFAYTCVDTDFVVFDSENLCLKNFYFKDIFNILKNKPVIYCNNTYQNIQKDVIKTSNDLIQLNNNDKWFFIKSYWFYEIEHVKNLITELKEIHGTDATIILNNKLFFEYQLYCNYLLKHNLKIFICADDFLTNDFNFNFQKILDERESNFEYIIAILNNENYQYYINIINYFDEKIVRLHWVSDEIKNKIIENSGVCIGTFHWDS